MPAPQMAREYYNLPSDAKFRDVILSIRADESIHRDVNHFVTDQDVEEPVETEDIIILNRAQEVKQTKLPQNPVNRKLNVI